MYFGQFYIDWYTGPQFALALGAVLSLFMGSGVVLVAAPARRPQGLVPVGCRPRGYRRIHPDCHHHDHDCWPVL